MMSASSTLLPRQRAGWVAAKASWWRTVCCCYCHRPHSLATIAVRPVSWRSRWQPLYYAATPGPQPRLMTNRELTVSAVCLREDGGRESNATYHTEPAKEGDHSFEKENIWTIPNVLSLSRILLSPVLGYQVLQGNYMMAFGLLIVAAVSDVVDGQIARHYPSQSSMLGSVLDPLADKCLVSVLCVALTVRDLFPLYCGFGRCGSQGFAWWHYFLIGV